MEVINYEIKSNLSFPFSYGAQHLLAAKNSVEWKGRTVHVILGIAEMIPLVNYIIAIFDRLFHPTWLWDLTTSWIPNFDQLPSIEQRDIELPFANVSIPGLGIRQPLSALKMRSCSVLQSISYPWHAVWREQDTKNWGSLVRDRNQAIIARANHPVMRGQDGEGNPVLIISRPAFRQNETIRIAGIEMTRTYVGNEVSLLFKDGTYLDMCLTNHGDCFSRISRWPEGSAHLISFIKERSLLVLKNSLASQS